MRWIREMQNPALKCERLGHRLAVLWRKGLVHPHRSTRWRSVADKVTQEKVACLRCGQDQTDWVVVKRSTIQSLSAPQSTYDAMDEGGSWDEHGVDRSRTETKPAYDRD